MEQAIFSIKPVGDRAVLVSFEEGISPEINGLVTALEQAVIQRRMPGVYQTVPSFNALMICYDCLVTEYEKVAEQVRCLAGQLSVCGDRTGKIVEIPVCYGGMFGEDLPFVAKHAGLSEEEVVRIHSGRAYRIYMIGFLPGFPYLGGLDERIFTPRLASPRTKIPAGSVGIGGEQTGIYPVESPGGWQIIGRTPLQLFAPGMEENLYQAGDEIRFVPISEKEFDEIARRERMRVDGAEPLNAAEGRSAR